MEKNKKNSFRRNLTRFNYWEDWSFINPYTKEEIYRIPVEGEKEIEKEIDFLLAEIKENRKYELIPRMIDLDYTWNTLLQSEISMITQNADTNPEYKKLLRSITKAINKDRRGSTELNKLKSIIEKDIRDFFSMLEEKNKGKTVEDITGNDSTHSKIWNNYIKMSRTLMENLNLHESENNDLDYIFNLYKFMNDNLDTATTFAFMKFKNPKKILLLKGSGVSGL